MSYADGFPILPLKTDYREAAFRAIEAVLREDPVLSGVVKTWCSRSGNAGADVPTPATDMMPIVALSPRPMGNTMEAIDLTRISFVVSVQLFVQGTCSADILNLWGAVEDAVVRSRPFRGTTVGAYLCSVLSPGASGVIRLWPSAPAFSDLDISKTTNSQAYSWGTGTLSSFILRPA